MPRESDFTYFLDPAHAIDGIVGLGGPLTTAKLLSAYESGIFPWPVNEDILPWCCPEERGILEFEELHVPRRLARTKHQFHFTIDRAFPQVINHCATVERKHESGTWITRQMIRAYCELHEQRHAHSVEVWEGDELVGGLYGVDARGSFSGESMFSLRSNASKLALLFLIKNLKERGLDWMDIQMVTPHLESLGGKVISRADFLAKLTATQRRNLILFPQT
jgi:leucyl/phenylalanyl-tRNA---protein transferase